MSLSSLPLLPEHLPSCLPLWKERCLYSESERRAALSAAAALLRTGAACGALIVDGARPRAFGLTGFVGEAFARDYLARPRRAIGRELLLRSGRNGMDGLLDRDGVARGNAGPGLTLVVLIQGDDVGNQYAPGWELVFAKLIESFQDVHHGYRLERIINEVFGALAMDVVSGTAAQETIDSFDREEPPSRVFALNRAQAVARRSLLLPMFFYRAPEVFFTDAEQELLRLAVSGDPDQVLSARLDLPLSAVKARWTRILTRFGDRFPDVRAPASSSRRRGRQTRHFVLDHVRRHPSELTPFRRPAS